MAHLNFQWSHPNPDGLTYKLYMDGELEVDNIAELNFSLLMDSKPEGGYTFYVTAFDTKTHLESAPSPSVNVNFTTPAAPVGLSVGWSE